MMLANIAPKECLDVIRLVTEGKLDEAQTLQTRLLETDWQILSRGVAGIKAAMNLLGFETGNPRAPMPPCDESEVEIIRSAMQDAGMLS